MAATRAFIAIPFPESVRTTLADLRRAAPSGAPVRWLSPDTIHLTLKFLGPVEEARLARVKERLSRIPWPWGNVSFVVAGVGAFPDLRRPRVVWAGITEGAERLVELAALVDDEMAALGFPREERRFSPHVTLGRVKEGGGAAWGEVFARGAAFEPITLAAERIVLFASLLRASGAVHTPLLDAPLAPGGPAAP